MVSRLEEQAKRDSAFILVAEQVPFLFPETQRYHI
jgi:hypothetical protein